MRFSYDPYLTEQLNFEEKFDRKVALTRRIKIVKTLGLAKQIYRTSLLTMWKPLKDRINKIIFNFIWEGKMPKVKKRTIIAEKKHDHGTF